MDRTLAHHQEELATRGYTVVADVLSSAEVTELREIVDSLYRLHDPEIDFAGLDVAKGQPDGRAPERQLFRREYHFATGLLTRHSSMWPLISREPVLSLIKSVIGTDCVLSSLNSLEPLHGQGHQALHRDEGPVGPEGYVTANSIWVLDSMDAGNGATRLIPGSHTTAELADDSDPRLIYASAPAGSVVVTNAHVLHGASVNRDGRRRRVIHGYFTRRGRKCQMDFRYYSSPAALARLPESCRALLDLG
ncbi:MAG TPA: phytanoyl-CoA dioxygenase family protein [Steroidobacteraceae bacterium]|nr:phytanoyl-CoA dioxygenase family protein [Steroidobacteraceae bacterium]